MTLPHNYNKRLFSMPGSTLIGTGPMCVVVMPIVFEEPFMSVLPVST